MSDLNTIDRLAARFSKACEDLDAEVKALQDEIEKSKRGHKVRLAILAGRAANAKAELQQAVADAPYIFTKPKTQVLSGVKCGFKKTKDSLDWDDDARLVARIKTRMPEEADLLIKVTEAPIFEALKNLSREDQRKLGIRSIEGGDQVVVAIAGDEIEKAVTKLVDTLAQVSLDEAA